MRILLLSASIVLASALLSKVFGQTCPTYDRRNNGNGGTCSSSDVIPSGKVRSGSFSFNTASNLTVERIEKNNTLVQEGSTLYSGTIFFGNLKTDFQSCSNKTESQSFFRISSKMAPRPNFSM